MTDARTLGALLLLLLGVPPAAHAQEHGFAPAGDVRIHYTLRGQGPPLLILNGGPGLPSTHFGPLADALSAHHRTILFDQRGTGRSTLPRLDGTTITAEAMVADVEAVREHLGIDTWIVMGHSWGGMYAMLYAARHPERVRALLLSASGGIDLEFTRTLTANLRARLTDAERAVLDGPRDGEDPAQTRRRRVAALAPAYVYHREHVPRVVEALTETSTYVPAVNALVFQDLRRIGYDLRAALRSFHKPVLIVQGRQDFLGEETALQIHDAFPRSTLVWIDECSHYLWWDQPEQYFETLHTFLASVRAQG